MVGGWIVFVGVAVNVLGTAIYVRHTLFGEVKPNRVTFFLWSVAPLIAGIAAVAKGVTWATVPVFAAALLPFSILIASYWNPKAYWKLSRRDYFYGVLSVAALVLWAITEEPNVAIAFAILSEFFATTPTLIKAWQYPETEYGPSYFGSSFNGFTAILAASAFTFEQIAFPLYLFIVMGIIGIATLRKP